MRILFLSLFFFILCLKDGLSQSDYLTYFRLKNKAEVAICQDQYANALNYYKLAFQVVDFPLYKELNNAFICSLLVGDTVYLYDSLSIYSGRIDLNRIENQYYIQSYSNTQTWKQFVKQANIYRTIATNSINNNYIRLLDSLDKEDQKPRQIGITKRNKIAKIDSLIAIATDQLMHCWDYPNERNTGLKYVTNSPICIWHRIDTTFINYEYQMLCEGKMEPELYVRKKSYASSIQVVMKKSIIEKDKYCRLSFSKLTTMELEEVNKNRSAIGFPTTEEWKILCKARKEKTEMGFIFHIFIL